MEKKGKQFKKIFYFCQEIECKTRVNEVSTTFYHKKTETLKLKNKKTMKKLTVLFASLMLLASTSVFAQSKGQIWLDGNIHFNSYSGEKGGVDKRGNSAFGINVSGNYMLDKNWSVGLGLGFESTSRDVNIAPDYTDKTSMFTVTLQGHYFMKLNKVITWTPRAYAYIGFGSENNETPMVGGGAKDEYDLSEMGLMIEPLNFQFNVSKNFALTAACDLATFGYTHTKNTLNKVDDTDNNLTFKCGSWSENLGNLGLRFGFRLFF